MLQENQSYLNEQNTRGRIFNVAARLFAEKGFNGVTMREISQEAEISKPTIYYYFGSKEGIYTELLKTELKQTQQEIESVYKRKLPARQKLLILIQSRFRKVLVNPHFVKFYLTLFISDEKLPFIKHFIAEARKRRVIIVDIIRQGIRDGEFGAGANPELAADIISGSLVHFIWKQLNSDEIILSDSLAKDLVDLLFRGLNE